ncbi:MAG TPA: radical SAM family heme chaperone HemW [Bacteroidales bacterium]|nr:radical SAM family heme chaperone HemW [Bacteroidales bacterium]
MSSIYIHIPYCKRVCYYCDFHFSVAMKNKDKLMNSLKQELLMRKDYLSGAPLQSIYFGGGTPSVLEIAEVADILNTIYALHKVSSDAEITFEANPDDLTKEYLTALRNLGINRLSIGVQSFHDKDLTWMNRRHNAADAERCIKLSQDCGFPNLNIDLIYGTPTLTSDLWQENLEKFASLDIPHLSAYHLTIEPKTVLGIWKKRGKLREITEDESLKEFNMLVDFTSAHGYEHYEISNFCKDGKYSRHNLNYWMQGTYLGAGPSAHSYDGKSRQWNIALNDSYIQKISQGLPYFEEEELSVSEQFNDYLLTHLRTRWGIQFDEVKTRFGEEYFRHLQKELSRYKDSGVLHIDSNGAALTTKGKLVADRVISELMWV